MDDQTTTDPGALGAAYEADGFVRLAACLPPDLVAGALGAIEHLEVDATARRTARAGIHADGTGPQRLVMHRPPDAVAVLGGHPAVVAAARACLATAPAPATAGEPEVIAWGHEVLTKRPTQEPDEGLVGWHQDQPYFGWWDGPTLTAWIALTEIDAVSGPVVYVLGSHRWGDRFDTTAFTSSPETTRAVGPPPGAAWVEVPVTGPAGTVTLHHPGTVHGSGPNHGRTVRRALAVRLRASTTRLRDDTPPRLRRALGG